MMYLSRLLNGPSVKYVLIEGQNIPQTDRLKARWHKNAPTTLKNTIFLPRMPEGDYLRLLDRVDLLLDPIYFGSGNTFYESMAFGTPMVTMPGEQMRGRIVAGGYKQMRLENAPIADTLQEYIELTVRLAGDAELRRRMKRDIKSAAHKYLFNDHEAADEIFEFIQAAIIEKKKAGGLLPVGWMPLKRYGHTLLKNAINCHLQGDLPNAEKEYRAAIDSGSSNFVIFSNLGIICQATQRTDEAIALYKKAIQINPNHPDAYTT